MTILQAITLGVTQGLCEFLPISSSAHLVLFPWILKWNYQGLQYDVFLHLGTLFAVVFYYRKEWVALVKDAVLPSQKKPDYSIWLIALATIPAGIAGIFLEDYAERIFRHPLLISAMLALFSIVLYLAQKTSDKRVNAKNGLSVKGALFIGVMQALAIVPGVSRSGAVITGAMFAGFGKKESAKISFLLSAPIIAGAAIFELRKINLNVLNAELFAGFAASAITGFLAIKFLLKLLEKRGYGIFVIYRLMLSAVIAALFFLAK